MVELIFDNFFLLLLVTIFSYIMYIVLFKITRNNIESEQLIKAYINLKRRNK